MKWLLDSNVLSEQVRLRPNESVLNWVARRPSDLTAISLVTMAELRVGALAAGPRRQRELTQWIEGQVTASFAGRILPVSHDILIDWLRLVRSTAAKGRTRAPADLLIAATARVHSLIVVTRNTRDFTYTGVVVHDPWTDSTHHMERP